ncbi:MAG: hypothetical protein ACPH2K_03420 [Flavicella sp.]
MKKIFLLLFVFVAISCGGDDSNGGTTPPVDNTEGPSAPKIVDLSVTENSASFTWEASSDPDGVASYELYLDDELRETITGLSHTFEVLNSETSYVFKIIPVDTLGNKGTAKEFTFTTDASLGSGDGKITTLTYPLNNESCNEGTTNSEDATKSDITFLWNSSTEVVSYELYLNNVSRKSLSKFSSTESAFDATIDKGATYSWWIITTYNTTDADGNSTTVKETSATHYFYSVGEAIESYVPYPSQLTSPANSSTLKDKEATNLVWSGSHPDGEIISYEVYFGSSTDPQLYDTTSSQSIQVSLESNTTYYWRVVAIDANGNTSTSQLYGFISE